MRTFVTRLITVTMALAMLMAVSAQAQEAVFGDAGWDSMKFHNAVAMLVAEEAYGLSTREISGSTAITYNALKTGDIHIYTETWTDNIAPYQQDVKDGKVIELGVNYADNIQGLYVPRYVIQGDESRGIEAMAPELKTVADLKDYADLFQDPEDPKKGRIYGAISGWMIDEIMRKKVEYYGLDAMYNYMDPGSDPALAAAIVGAYEKGEPIVAYYWEPAWITGKYDLVLLEDAPYEPEGYLRGETGCPSVRLTVAVNPGFYESYPEFCGFLSNYYSSSALTSEALAYISDNDASYGETARWFLTEHDEMIDDWLPEDKAALVRAALDWHE
ncbi:MAG: ABC transporter substrate-binding protein [Eubacteriales bacterium]|nr:ABC transporter substrate-binding protein [Eubacteriales bacterium]